MLISGILRSFAKPSRIKNCVRWSDNSYNEFPLKELYTKELKNMLTEISKLSERDQVARATTLPNGKVTVTDENGKEISLVQVSLKKGEGAARIGKVGTLIRLTPDPVKQIKETVWSENDLVLLEFNLFLTTVLFCKVAVLIFFPLN